LDFKMKNVAVAIGISLLCGPLAAQQVDPAVAEGQSRKAFDDCVYKSVATQLKQMSVEVRRDANSISLGEQGFVACATEERALGMDMIANNFSPPMVQATLLGIRAQIKQTVRQIVADAEKDPQ
jgi:hypothetical protein